MGMTQASPKMYVLSCVARWRCVYCLYVVKRRGRSWGGQSWSRRALCEGQCRGPKGGAEAELLRLCETV